LTIRTACSATLFENATVKSVVNAASPGVSPSPMDFSPEFAQLSGYMTEA
jgi:hypothetical protein